MRNHVKKAIRDYANAYQKLYQRPPLNFHTLDGNWVIIDGVAVRVADLETLTARLEAEYEDIMAQKREVVERLIEWCKQ